MTQFLFLGFHVMLFPFHMAISVFLLLYFPAFCYDIEIDLLGLGAELPCPRDAVVGPENF
jgi:hypothetical protein